MKWGCLSDVTLHHSSQGEGSVGSLLHYLILSPIPLLTVRLFSGSCLLTSCTLCPPSLFNRVCGDVAMCQLPSALYSGKSFNAFMMHICDKYIYIYVNAMFFMTEISGRINRYGNCLTFWEIHLLLCQELEKVNDTL